MNKTREKIDEYVKLIGNTNFTQGSNYNYLMKMADWLDSQQNPKECPYECYKDFGDDKCHHPQPPSEKIDSCPPHDLADYTYVGGWSASVPPPNKKCKKCLLEVRF